MHAREKHAAWKHSSSGLVAKHMALPGRPAVGNERTFLRPIPVCGIAYGRVIEVRAEPAFQPLLDLWRVKWDRVLLTSTQASLSSFFLELKSCAQRHSFDRWCPWPESNQHSLRNSILSRARLPVPPQGPSVAGRMPGAAKRGGI